MTKATRRVAIGAIGSLAATAIIARHAAASSVTNGDVAIEAAFKRRRDAYTAFKALPERNGPVIEGYGPHERELWEVIDTAEHIIRTTTATTPRGVMLQLWCAMYHSVSGREDDEAIHAGDFAAVDRLDNDLDWNARLMLAALRSLQAMEA